MKMLKNRFVPSFCCLLLCLSIASAAPVILNEYNAVSGSQFLNGGTSSADIDGGYASDSYFGRVAGNGGDWFEIVVIEDHLDMRSWRFTVSYFDGFTRNEEVLRLTNHSLWSNIRSGTIITISEDVPDNVSYNPAAGDWWINVRANDPLGSGTYIERQNFPVNNDDWQLIIANVGFILQFGPAGEGIAPNAGVSNTEIFRLQANPSASITADSIYYNDGITLSTFGSENRWPGGNVQDFTALRAPVVGIPQPGLFLQTLNGTEVLTVGETYPVIWATTGSVSNVLIEYSANNGSNWTSIITVPNTGSYDWPVPAVNSNDCLVRISDANNLSITDTSDNEFTILTCPSSFAGDLNGDCYVNLLDLSILADDWLNCGNPLDPNCTP